METLLRRSLHTIKALKEINQSAKEPIAVIGMSCRFPGGCTTPEKFWEFLQNKGDGVRDIPQERWDVEEFYDPEPGVPGKMYLRQANFLQEDVGQFDARFFRISPLEAAEMDPQQRILLELSWEALERAGQNVEQLKESNTGVFIGIIGSDYSRLPRDPSKVNPYRGTGSIPSIASGRIAHVLGFHGPALSVDTTCSSSLVSLQLACDSLRKQKCDMALAGGVNMMLSPNPMISLCMMNALSADGRCRPFDGDGQGYGRAEGAGLVVLKRLSTAVKDNDPILAVIRSTAVNQDGPSSGLTVPNGNAQRELIKEALRDAGLNSTDVNYLEAHGTGTSLGDPIEVKAVKEALGENRSADNPLLIGSVKGNVGHLEGAAGICGLIKVVLCLQHQQIPPNINLETLNPRVPLKQIPAQVPAELTDWLPADGREMVAGLSSFGFSGTNAHAILTEVPASASKPAVQQPLQPLSVMTLSAKTEWAFKQLLHSYRDYLQANPDIALDDLCYTANTCRADFAHRAAFMATDVAQILRQLEALLEGKQPENTLLDKVNEETGQTKVALLFTGHSQALNRELYDVSPVFREYLQQCDALFKPHLGISVVDCLYANAADNYSTQVQHAALFSAQYAAGQFLLSLNIKPAAVWAQTAAANYAAACVAGILSLQDAAALLLDVNHTLVDGCQPPHCRFIAPDSGQAVKKSALLNPAYWQDFPASIANIDQLQEDLQQQGYQHLLVLGGGADQLSADKISVWPIQDSWERLICALAELYCNGMDVDWRNLYPGEAKPNKILLPTYPFERKRYWSPLKPSSALISEHSVAPANQAGAQEPLQGRAVMSPMHSGQFEYAYELSLNNLPEAQDTHGIIHVGYYQEILRRAVAQAFDTAVYAVAEKTFLSALILSDEQITQARLLLEPDKADAKQVQFRFYSQTDQADEWELHVTGSIRLGETAGQFDTVPESVLTAIKQRCREHCSGETFYGQLQQRNINLGPAVQWVDEVWSTPGEVLARFKVPSSAAQFDAYALKFHPGIIDACAQIFHSALWDDTPEDMKFMVIKWHDFVYQAAPQDQTLWCHVLLEQEGVAQGSIRGSFDLFDGKGNRVASAAQNEMKGLKGFNVRELKKLKEEAKSQPKGVNTALQKKLAAAATAEQRNTVLIEHLQQITTDVLNIPSEDINPADSLMDMGMDSMTGIMFQAAIERDIGVELPLENIIQGPSLTELTAQLVAEMPNAVADEQASPIAAVSGQDDADWFVHSKYRDSAKMRLFCLPYGGGGATVYAQWQEAFANDVDVCAIQLPHRENRLKEPAITHVDAMIDALVPCITSRLDVPFAFYGHSMGALLAYRLAYRLWQQGQSAAHLFVGGFSSPLIYPNPLLDRTTTRLQALGMDAIPTIGQVGEMPEAQLKQFASTFSGFRRIPDEEKELRRLLLPIFVGDLQLVASYQPQAEELFDIPLSAFHGINDEEVTQPEMAAWEELTRGTFNLHTLPGDHMFLQKDQSRDALLQLLSQELAAGVSSHAVE